MATFKKTNTSPIKGNKVWYFIQSTSGDSDAILPAHQTSGSLTIGGNMIDEQTKMGRILGKESNSQTISLEQYFAPDDEGLETIIKASEEGRDIKIWRVVVDESAKKGDGYPAKFGYGVPDSISITDGNGFVSVSYSINIIGTMQNGTFKLTADDLKVLELVYNYENPSEYTGSILDGTHKKGTTTFTTKD